jgi:hypothetical protein
MADCFDRDFPFIGNKPGGLTCLKNLNIMGKYDS